jgi:hydroxyethylthiazole kinase
MLDAYETLRNIRREKPLVHHITNWVTIYDCAHLTRCVGALPVMAHAKEEVAQMTGIAQALVLNIGTLTTDLVDAMITAGKAANRKGIPVVLDAVGAGATDMRTAKAKEILEAAQVAIIKGNPGEIAAVADVPSEVKGVESMEVEGDPLEVARTLSSERSTTVVVTGKTDLVVGRDGATYRVHNGHSIMGQVVGTGCMAASMIGAFVAVNSEYAQAAAEALACFGIAGQRAAGSSRGPGTFRELFFDEIFHLRQEVIRAWVRVEQV